MDLLFIELGAVVTEVLGPRKCTIEPFCNVAQPPTFGADRRVEVDLALSIDDILGEGGPDAAVRAAQNARYDQHDQMRDLGGVPIGSAYPGGGYEGILCVRAEVVRADKTLAAAAASLPGHPWEYQVIVSIDETTGKVVRRYHGFHAEVVDRQGKVLELDVANAGKSKEPGAARTRFRYDPANATDAASFYSGAVAANLLGSGAMASANGSALASASASAGAVFIALEQIVQGPPPSLPKLPPDAGSPEIERPLQPLGRPMTGIVTNAQRTAAGTATVIMKSPPDEFLQSVEKVVKVRIDWPVPDPAARERLVRELLRGATRVDLVGHSTPIKGFLSLGDWVLDSVEAGRLASYMPLSVQSVRLIGCGTAKTSDGCKALEALAQNGLSAWGTINNVYTTHFDENGVKSAGAGPGLKEFSSIGPRCDGLRTASDAVRVSPPAQPPTDASGMAAIVTACRTRLAGLLRAACSVMMTPFVVMLWLVRRMFSTPEVPDRWISWLLDPRWTQMPGLLTEPLLVYDIAAGHKNWKLEILFDFTYARFYATTDSPAKQARVYKIRRSAKDAQTLLEPYLSTPTSAAVTKDVALRQRHREAGVRGGLLKPSPTGTQASTPTTDLSRSGSLASTV